MATFKFKDTAGYPSGSSAGVVFKRNINMPDLVAYPGKLIDGTTELDVSLPSTGFAAADILQVFQVPAGFLLTSVGVRVSTVEGAACTADIGNASATQTHRLAANADGYMGTCNLNSATAQITLIADEDIGGSTYEGVVFITAGSIDLTFGSADTETCVFDIWAVGFRVW